jgi:malonyl-CoA decarboxylase
MAARAETRGSAPVRSPAGVLTDLRTVGGDRVAADLTAMPAADRRELVEATADLDGGLRALVELRHDVMGRQGESPHLRPVEETLRATLTVRFERGSLEFRAIGPDAPERLLDQLTDYEAVHPIRDRIDLLRRLDPVDRRCFALFHPDLDDDPLVFVEVALTRGLAPSVQDVLDGPPVAELSDDTDTATFYSITDCQPGLRGVAFGAELLHRTMDELATTTPVDTFATLSPIPGFVRWLGDDPPEPSARLAACARYLLTAKRGSEPLDPVARFHLGNGARLERLNLGGDTSLRGLTRYLGITANYRYGREHLAENQAAYRRGTIVASAGVRSLLDR